MRRERLSVVANEHVGPYTLLRVARGGIDPGVPGQFFMLEAPGRLLPRPMSLCLAPRGELAFLIDAIGPERRRSASSERRRFTFSVHWERFRPRSERRCSSAAVSGLPAAVPVRGARSAAGSARVPF
jgi:hypothetical protein